MTQVGGMPIKLTADFSSEIMKARGIRMAYSFVYFFFYYPINLI